MRWLLVLLVACQQGGPAPAAEPLVGTAPQQHVVQPPLDVSAPADPVVAIGRGVSHACVVRQSGAVDCWGQPVTNCRDCKLPPKPDSTMRRMFSDGIAVSPHAGCILRRGGTVACFDEATGALVDRATHVTAISDGACHLLANGSSNCDSQLRGGMAIASAARQTCAITKDGRLWCNEIEGIAFSRVDKITHARALAMGIWNYEPVVCVIADAGVTCTALGSRPDLPPTDKLAGATQIAFAASPSYSEFDLEETELDALVGTKLVGANGAVLDDVRTLGAQCAIRTNGAVACWGWNQGGVLAQPTSLGTLGNPPTPQPGIANVKSIAAGFSQAWALRADNSIVHWGREHAATVEPVRPFVFSSDLGQETWVQLAASYSGTLCARSMIGHVWCRRFRAGEETNFRVAAANVTDIQFVGSTLYLRFADHTSASTYLDDDGITMLTDTWQSDGVGLRFCSWSATGVECEHQKVLGAATHVVFAGDFICGIVDGTAACVGGPTFAPMPIRIPHATDLHANQDRACALADGAITCWGLDGKPSTVIAKDAVAFSLGPGFDGLWAQTRNESDGPPYAGEYGCAVMTDRTAQCWGASFDGELFDNSLVYAHQPVGIRL